MPKRVLLTRVRVRAPSHGGTLDLTELKHGMKRLRSATQTHFRGPQKRSEEMQRVDGLRARAAAAREAIACARRADAKFE